MENYLLEMKDISKIYGNGIVANEIGRAHV